MKAFLAIVAFELRFYLKRISTWVYFALFFATTFLMTHAMAGAFGGGVAQNVVVNSPTHIVQAVMSTMLIQLLVTAALMGNSIYRDFEVGIHPLFFSAPVSKPQYFGGRFVGATLANLVVNLGGGLGMLVATAMPYLEADRFGPFRLEAYVYPYVWMVIPNLIFTGAIFFSLAAYTRQMLPNYVGSIVLFVAYGTSQVLLSNLEHRTLAAMLEPFGFAAAAQATRYWTVAQNNVRLLPVSELLLANRALWLAVGLVILAGGYRLFAFSHAAPTRAWRKRRDPVGTSEPAAAGPRRLLLPPVHRDFSGRAAWAQFARLARIEFKGIVGNVYFRAIVAAGLVLLGVAAYFAGQTYGTGTYPVTALMVGTVSGVFTLILMVIIAFQAGELVWRDREHRINGITDSMPLPTVVWFGSKLAALVTMVALLKLVVMLFGIGAQAIQGYFRFEIGLYLQTLLGYDLVEMAIWCVFALLIHAVANHKYLGHVVVIGFFIANGFMGLLGLEHALYRFNSGGTGTYSDMNGYGYGLQPFLWYKLYWGAFAVLLAVAANLLWVRGTESAWRQRMAIARSRFRGPIRRISAVASLAFIFLGGFIFYNTNVLNTYRTSGEERGLRAAYEKKYKRFEHVPQPRIVDVDLRVDMFPTTGAANVSGRYVLINRTSAPIDSVHVLFAEEDVEVEQLSFDRASRPVLNDKDIQYRIYDLAKPLAPGDSLQLRFRLAYVPSGFKDGGEVSTLVDRNGTFFNYTAMPIIGYDPRGEISEDRDRKKEGLKPKPRMPPPTDQRARRNNMISHDADWIRFSATLSTSADQIAIAPGYLQREWKEGGRRYFEYRMDAPMLNFYSINSARYTVEKDRWRGPDGREVAIEVYHHPSHTYNVERMIRSVKRSLDYFSANFGPYQHRQVRILEFPRPRTFAQSFANTIPFSEGMGFIVKVKDDEDKIDYPFFVTAHEVAHQWWGHQALGAPVQGSHMLMESLAEYSALMVMEKEYGPQGMKKFLEHLLDAYLSGRATESKRETPLLLTEGQQYVHYQKGGLVFYALRDLIGEAKLNAALRRYLDEVKFQTAPYTTSLELYTHLRAATPDSLHGRLADMFEHITIYENRTHTAKATRAASGGYLVEIDVEAHKVRVDSLGNDVKVAMNEWVDVGVFAESERGQDETSRPLYLKKHRLQSGRQTLRIPVASKPARAGVDPLHRLIDRRTDDNLATVRLPS